MATVAIVHPKNFSDVMGEIGKAMGYGTGE
jgi:hypothetical protein